MDGNSNPDGVKKKGGEILGWVFCFPFCKNCKAQGEKKGGDQNAIKHLSTKRITTN